MILSTGPAGQPGSEIARGKDWTSIALDGDVIWVAQAKGNAGAIRQVAQDDAPDVAVPCKGKPSGLRVQDGKLYWVERLVAGPAAPSFIPTLSDQVVVRMREREGNVRDLASWPAGVDPKSRPQLPEVIAISETALFLRVPRLYSTEFVEVPLQGGEPARIAVEAEVQFGAFYGGAFHWTARSREAMIDLGMRRVCRRNGAEVETVAEWLPPSGSLVATAKGLYYIADGVYRIPEKLAMPKRLGGANASIGAPDPNGIVLVNPSGGRPPLLFTEK